MQYFFYRYFFHLSAFLEGNQPIITETLGIQLDDGILLQNMDNSFKETARDIYDSEMKKNTAVLYLTIVSTLASTRKEDSSVIIDDLLENWKKVSFEEGRNVDILFASVEINGKNNTVQRAYFPIPDFVNQFWFYPETQKAKNELVLRVSRESPEEKISDFYRRMNALEIVMRRQQQLNR
jgi:hypothetical protein